MFCKPTFICDDIILPFTGHELVRKDKFLRVRLIKLRVVLEPYNKGWFATRKIRDNDSLAKLAKISRLRINVGLQYLDAKSTVMDIIKHDKSL